MRRLRAILAVYRRWFYARATTPPRDDDTALRDRIEEIVLVLLGCGYRRVTETWYREELNYERVPRIIREESLLCPLERHWIPTTDARHGLTRSPNLVKDRVVTGLNQVWIADTRTCTSRGPLPTLRRSSMCTVIRCLSRRSRVGATRP